MELSNINNTTLSTSQLEQLEDVVTDANNGTEVEEEEFQAIIDAINQKAIKLEKAYTESSSSIFSALNFMAIAYDHTMREYEIYGPSAIEGTDQSGSTSDKEDVTPPSSEGVTDSSAPSSGTSNEQSNTSSSTTKNTYGIEGVPSASHLKNTKYDSIITEMSEKYEVPFDLIKLVINTESSFNPNAVSSSNAQGLMQLIPSTAKWLGVKNSMDPYQNIEGGTKYLRYLLDKYDNDLTLAVAAYNAGPGNVDKYGGVPPFKETQNYVKKILGK